MGGGQWVLWCVVAFAALLGCLTPPRVDAFKAHDFKTCATSSFCQRHRDRSDGETSAIYAVAGPFVVRGHDAIAQLAKQGETRALSLRLTSYADGVVRVFVDDPEKPRYAVPDVLVNDLDKRRAPFASVKPDGPSRTLLGKAQQPPVSPNDGAPEEAPSFFQPTQYSNHSCARLRAPRLIGTF